jgi:lysophospholipase L1-like esterase
VGFRRKGFLQLAAALLAVGAVGVSAQAPAVSATAVLPPMDTSQHFRIMPLGDSITYGEGSTTGDGYRWNLARYMTETEHISTAWWVGSVSSGQEPNPANEGHPGWTIAQLSEQITGWMAASGPDLVLLHAGVNDARTGASDSVMTDRMRVLLGRILAASPTVRVIVADVIPPWSSETSNAASFAVQLFNARLPALVSEFGPRVTLARMSVAVSNAQLGDGLHPNDTGYRYMAWVWWRCMAPLLSSVGTMRSGPDPLPVPVPVSEMCPTL